MSTPFKMKGFSGFGNESPMRQDKTKYTAADSTAAQNLAYDLKEGDYTKSETKSIIGMAGDKNPSAVSIYKGVKNKVINREYTTADINAGVPGDDPEYVNFHVSKTLNKMIKKNKSNKKKSKALAAVAKGVKAIKTNKK